MAKKFMGTDRRLLKKFKTVIDAVHTRDQMALNPKKTSKLSTRDLIVDVTDPDTAVAWQAIRDLFTAQVVAGRGAVNTTAVLPTITMTQLNFAALMLAQLVKKRWGKTPTEVNVTAVTSTTMTINVVSNASLGGDGTSKQVTMNYSDLYNTTTFFAVFQSLTSAPVAARYFNSTRAAGPHVVSFSHSV